MCCIGLLTTLAINVSVHVPPFVSKESVRDLIVLNISKSNLREHILSKKMIELYKKMLHVRKSVIPDTLGQNDSSNVLVFNELLVVTEGLTWSYFLNVKCTGLHITIYNFSDICYVFFHNGITI